MTTPYNKKTRSQKNKWITLLPYLIICAFLITSFYFFQNIQTSNIQGNQEIQAEYELLNTYRTFLNDIQTLLVKILKTPNVSTQVIVFKELEKTIQEWKDDNAIVIVQSLKSFVSDIALLNQEIEESFTKISMDQKRKIEKQERIERLNKEVEKDINNIKSIISELSQKVSGLTNNDFRDIEKSIIQAFSSIKIQNQTLSKKLEQELNQLITLLKNSIESIQKVLNCRIYVQAIKDLIISSVYSIDASDIISIKNDVDALFDNIQIVLNQFDNQNKLSHFRVQFKSCHDLTRQFFNYKINLIESAKKTVQIAQDARLISLKDKLISNIELMAHQLKQYKDDVERQKYKDLSTKLNQLFRSMDDSKVDESLNDIRSNLNKVNSLYHIRNLIYELNLKIMKIVNPDNINASTLTINETRSLYNQLNKDIRHSTSLRKIFSGSNYYNLMEEVNSIYKKIEQVSNLRKELDDIHNKIEFESKNKEYVITNTFIKTNQSLIKILESIQTIEKKISECQLRIKKTNKQEYHQYAYKMIILAIIFSILFVCSLLFRYRYEIRDIKIKTDGKVARTALKSSVNRKLIFSAIFLLIISLSFNALLSLGSLEKLYVKSTVSQYQIIGTDLQRNIDRSLRYGKKLDKFVRMNIMLSDTQYSLTTKYLKDQTQTQWQDIDLNVSIALPDWKMIYSTNKDFVGKYIPERVQINYTDVIKNHESNNESNWTKYKDRYYITLPVKGGERKEWAGTVIIDFNDTQIRGFLKNIFFNNMKIIGAILVVGSILLFICLNLIVNRAKNELPRIFISVVMLFIIGLSQAIFSFINSSEFKKFYLQINIQKAEIMTAMLKEDVDYFLDKGVKINKLVKMENILKEVIDVSPELEDISIYDENNDILHLANKDHAIDYVRSKKELKALDLTHSERGSEFQLKKNLNQTIKDDNEYSQSVTKGSIITNISKKALFDKIFEIRIDSITVLIISFLFMVELLIMIFRIIQSSDHSKGAQPKIEFSDIRPVMFIYFFSFDLCISFLPLFMEQLYTPMFGLSKDIVLSLPIALEMFFAGITTIIAGWLLDRINWHLPFIYGLIICSIGSFYSWLSPDAYHLLFSRCLAGIGYGFSFMAAQGFIISYTDNKTKTQGLTQLFAGLMAGSICGGAAGAMIADRIGYAPIFFISGMLLFVTVLYTLYFMRAGFKKKVVQKRTDEESVEKDSKGLKLIMKFIFNRNIFSLLLLGILPTAFSIVGFINFFYPVYLNRLGETQSNIGRIYMIYGLCLIYIAPLLSKFVDRSDNKKLFIVITGLIGGMAFTSFYYTAGLWATVITVLLLGISSSFDASRTYALNLKITKTLGEGVAMGIFNLAEKVGQVVGPLIFGLFFITTSVNNTMAIFGIVYIIITLLFMVTAQSDKKIKMQNR